MLKGVAEQNAFHQGLRRRIDKQRAVAVRSHHIQTNSFNESSVGEELKPDT